LPLTFSPHSPTHAFEQSTTPPVPFPRLPHTHLCSSTLFFCLLGHTAVVHAAHTGLSLPSFSLKNNASRGYARRLLHTARCTNPANLPLSPFTTYNWFPYYSHIQPLPHACYAYRYADLRVTTERSYYLYFSSLLWFIEPSVLVYKERIKLPLDMRLALRCLRFNAGYRFDTGGGRKQLNVADRTLAYHTPPVDGRSDMQPRRLLSVASVYAMRCPSALSFFFASVKQPSMP